MLLLGICHSHSQSQVERVFNINADIMMENLHNDSLIAKRIFCDYMKSKDLQPSKIKITQKMRCSSITVYSKYNAALGNQKKNKHGSRNKQGKPEVTDRKINNVNNEISEVEATISTLNSKAGDCHDATEETNADIATLVVMRKSFRKVAKEKGKVQQELEDVVDNLNNKK